MVGGAHNDALMMLLVMLAVAALLSAREVSGGVALVAAAATKASALFLAPFVFVATAKPQPTGLKHPDIEENRPIGRLLAGAGFAAAAVCGAAYLGFGWDWLHAFGLAGENQGRTSHLSLPITLARLTGLDPTTVRAAALTLYAALVIYLLVKTWQGHDWLRAAAWAAFGLLLATSWLLPWYLIWPLPLAAISRDRTLQLLTLALTAYQLGVRIPL